MLLLLWAEFAEIFGRVFGLAMVAKNRAFGREGLQIVHEPRFGAQPPQRRGAQLVGRIGWPSLNDAVTGSDVMEKEVAEGMNLLVAVFLHP